MNGDGKSNGVFMGSQNIGIYDSAILRKRQAANASFQMDLDHGLKLTSNYFYAHQTQYDANRYPYGPAGTAVSLPLSERRLSVQKIYSHPTAHALQIRKLFALESMHDLRLSPEEQITCSTVAIAHCSDYPRISEEDYFRRAPRANELFFSFNKTGVRTIIQDFLAHYDAAQGARFAQQAH